MLTVCNYHYIRPNFDTNYPSIFGVTPSAFKKQLKLLKDKGDFVSPQDLISNVKVVLSSKFTDILDILRSLKGTSRTIIFKNISASWNLSNKTENKS
jgi:hypothetical protein